MTEKIVLKILMVDDDEDDYLLTREMLAMAHGKEVQLKWASSIEDGRQAIFSDYFDAVLIDYDLGKHTGLELIRECVAQNYSAPLILITGRGGYEVDLEAMQAGATLYLTKAEVNPPLLDRSIRYAIERKQAELALNEARQDLEKRVEERTRELAQANRELREAKEGLEARVAERTTELQHTNEQLASLSQLYATLSRVNETIVRTHDEEKLLSKVCEAVAEGGFPLVWIGEIHGEQVLPIAHCGTAADYLKEIKIEVHGLLGNGPTGTCIREDRSVVNADFATNPATLPWREAALRFGIRASASFPLHRQGKPTGAFTIYASEPNVFNAEQVALLERLSADISFALDALDQERLRIKVEQALSKSEERYRSLFDGMTEGFALHEIICDEQGKPCDYRFLEVNQAFEKLTGLKRTDVIGKRHNEILPGDDPYWTEAYGAVALGGAPVHFENYSPALKQYYEVFAYSPAPKQFAVQFMKVTERKQLDEKLRESEQRYRSLFEGMQEGFYLAHFIYDGDGNPCDFEYLDINPAFERIMGLPREKIIGRRAKDLVPNLKPEWVEVLSKVERTGEPVHHVSYSEVFGQYFEAFAFRPSEGQFAVLVTDISDHKEAEEKLLQQSRLIELSYEPIFTWDLEHGILTWNQGCEQIYGFSKDEAVGRSSHELLKTRYPVPLESFMSELESSGSWTGELNQRAKDRREVIIESRQQVIKTAGKQLVLETNRDITERKHAEETLRETRARIDWLARFPEENPNPIARVALDGRVLYYNPSAGNLHEWWSEPGRLLPGQLIALVEQAVTQGSEIDQDVPLGDKVYSISAIPLLEEGYVNLYGRDATRRKKAEDAQRQSEEWFRTTLASIGDAVVTTDEKGMITFLNPVAEKLSGWKRQEATGLPMQIVFPLVNEQTGQPAENPIDRVLQSGTVVGLANHTGLITRDANIIPIEDSASPIKDTSGQTLGVVMVFHDVTEKRLKETALHRSEALYRSIARNFPDGAVFVTDHDLRYLVIEGTIVEQMALSRERMEGHTIFEVLDPEMLALVVDRYRQALAGESLSVETSYRGRVLWSQYLPLRDEAGAVLGAMAMTIDITGRKQGEESLREAEKLMKDYAQKLERSNRELQDFAAIASHDLQEPLRKIKAFSDLFQTHMQGRLDDQGKDYLERIQSSAGRMQELIESLLNYSRVTTKTQPFRPVDLHQITSDVISGLEVQLEQVGAQIQLGDLPGVEADPIQMRQLLQNLIGNALKFHRAGVPPVVQVTGCIVTSTDDHGSNVARIEVKDNGIGFEMKYLDRIFRPFERLHGRNEFEGTGMGLAICKKIVERHQGTITAQSIVGEGTTFIVILPVKQVG